MVIFKDTGSKTTSQVIFDGGSSPLITEDFFLRLTKALQSASFGNCPTWVISPETVHQDLLEAFDALGDLTGEEPSFYVIPWEMATLVLNALVETPSSEVWVSTSKTFTPRQNRDRLRDLGYLGDLEGVPLIALSSVTGFLSVAFYPENVAEAAALRLSLKREPDVV